MRRLRFIAGVLGSLALIVGMAGNAAAKAQSASAVTDCQKHGQLTQHYTVSQLEQALHSMPASVQEYSNCAQVIQRAINDGLANEKGGTSTAPAAPGSGGGSGTLIVVIVIVVIVLVGGCGAYFAWHRRGDGGSQPPTGNSA